MPRTILPEEHVLSSCRFFLPSLLCSALARLSRCFSPASACKENMGFQIDCSGRNQSSSSSSSTLQSEGAVSFLLLFFCGRLLLESGFARRTRRSVSARQVSKNQAPALSSLQKCLHSIAMQPIVERAVVELCKRRRVTPAFRLEHGTVRTRAAIGPRLVWPW